MLRPKNKTFHREDAHVICGFYKEKTAMLIIAILFSEVCYFKNIYKLSSGFVYSSIGFWSIMLSHNHMSPSYTDPIA